MPGSHQVDEIPHIGTSPAFLLVPGIPGALAPQSAWYRDRWLPLRFLAPEDAPSLSHNQAGGILAYPSGRAYHPPLPAPEGAGGGAERRAVGSR